MKLIPVLLLFVLFACGSEPKPLNLKNVKAGNLQFFETYGLYEILDSWKAACTWVSDQDTLEEGENPYSLGALVHLSNENMVGYVLEENMSQVDSMLAIPEVQNNFFKNLRFMWSYGVEETQNGQKMYALYAVKVPDNKQAIIDGRHIQHVETGISEFTQQPIIKISMTDQGSHDWEIITRKNIGRAIAITIDDHVLSCPVVHDAIVGGETEISGNFTKAGAEELAARIYMGRRK